MRLQHFAESGEVVGGVERYLEILLAAATDTLEHGVIVHGPGPCRYAGRWPSASWPWRGPRIPDGSMPAFDGLPVFHAPPSPATLAGLGRAPYAVFCHDHRWWCPSGSRFYHRTLNQCHIRADTASCGVRYHFLRCGSLRPQATIQGFIEASLAREALAAASIVLCASRFMRDEAVRHGADAQRVRVIPLPTAIPGATTTRPRGTPRILSPARLTPEKGVAALLDAFDMMGEVAELEICGDGIQAAEIADTVQTHAGAARITLRGRVGAADIEAAYGRASLVAVPSLWPEPFGLVGIEALARGLPVVTSASGGSADWAREDFGVLTAEPRDPAAFAAALDRAITEPVWSERAREVGAPWVAARHSIDAHVAALVAALDVSPTTGDARG